jgi:hypothetical protein
LCVWFRRFFGRCVHTFIHTETYMATMRSTPASRLLKLLFQQNMAHHVHVRFFFLRWEDFLGAWSVLISSAIAVQIYAKHMLNTCRDAGASVFITIVDSLSSHRRFSDKHLGLLVLVLVLVLHAVDFLQNQIWLGWLWWWWWCRWLGIRFIS